MIRNKIVNILVLIISFTFQNAFAEEKIVFSTDLIRHGDRTSIYQIPKSYLYWKEGLGELTEKGINQERHLGEKLRIQYVDQYHLLPKIYDSSSIYVRSTDSARTIKSAHSLLLGLYPQSTRVNNKEITVHIFQRNEDNLLIVKPSKNIFSIIKRYVVNLKFWKEKTVNLQYKLKYWAEVTGLPLNNFQQLDQLADNIYVRQSSHISLPKGISNKDADEIISLNEAAIINEFKLKSVTNPMGRALLKTVSNYMKQVTRHNTPIKYVLLSGHDSSIMSVMNTLQSPLEQMPEYASRLNFSLINKDNRYYVKVTYNDNPVFIQACKSSICTLSQFDRLAGDS
jgi:lysosomal acid phosphatase